jgi:hypothetical protein
MIRVGIILLALAAPAAAQLREVVITLAPTECVNCTESLPARMQRVRGVAGAEMMTDPPRVTVRLEQDNRVRLTRLLDVVRQDGTGATAIQLTAMGEVFEQAGAWRFRVLPGDAALEWKGEPPARAGRHEISGRMEPPFGAIHVAKAALQP